MESGPVETHLPRAAGRLHAHADRLRAEARAEGRDPPASARRSPPIAPPVLEVEQSRDAFRLRRQRRQGGRRRVARGRSRARRSASSASPARARPRWAAACCASTSPTAGRIDYRRAGRQRRRPCERRQADAEGLPARDPHDLPGSGRLAQSAHDGGPDHRRAAAGQRHRQGHGARRPRRRPAAPGRARAVLARALSARLLRRPAPAHRHRARDRAQPAPHRRRRGDLGARRVAARRRCST